MGMHELRHPDPDKEAGRIDADKYGMMKKALLKAIPKTSDGIPFSELREKVRKHLPKRWNGSVGWYVTSVKLDLEAHGVIERVPGARPQRLRRC